MVWSYIQWNLTKMDTIGTEPCVHYMEGVLYSEVFGLSPRVTLMTIYFSMYYIITIQNYCYNIYGFVVMIGIIYNQEQIYTSALQIFAVQ